MKVTGVGTIVLLATLCACAGDSAAPTQREVSRGGGARASDAAVFAASGNGKCSAVRMTETGIMGEDGQWHAHGLISIGGGPVETVTSVTANTGFRPAGMAARGSEVWTITVGGNDNDTFVVEGNFTIVPGTTPGGMELAESGKITSGTGRFNQASGQVALNGPALFEDDVHGTWLGSLLGEICQ